MELGEVEKNIGYTFKDKGLLTRALTLASADADNNNQTLEFFGDAILEFLVSERIYDEKRREGELTELRKTIVSDRALEPVSRRLKLDKYLIKSSSDNTNKKAVPSAYEAVCAAIYLDGGIEAARKFVLSTLDFSQNGCATVNYKGALQELTQGDGLPLPVYERRELGTAQNPKFEVKLTVFGNTFRGVGESVKQAEQNAAKAAIDSVSDER